MGDKECSTNERNKNKRNRKHMELQGKKRTKVKKT